MTPEEEIKRKLAKIDESAEGGLREMRFFTLRKVLVGLLLGVAAATLVFTVLDVSRPKMTPPPPKPMQVQILPGK